MKNSFGLCGCNKSSFLISPHLEMFNLKILKRVLVHLFSIALWVLIVVKHILIFLWKRGPYVVIIVNSIVVVWCLTKVWSIGDDVSRWNMQKPCYNSKSYMDEQLQHQMLLDKGRGCPMPYLDPFSPEAVKYDVTHPKVKCDGVDWVKCNLSECKVIPTILDTHKYVICTYRDLMYLSDDACTYGPPVVKTAGRVYHLRRSDYAAVKCSGIRKIKLTNSNVTPSPEAWIGLVAGFRSKKQKPSPKGRENATNVLVFAFDSTPRTGFIRRMPKSYKFLTENLKATVLKSYNIVGEATFSALLPILTGRNQFELPDARRNSDKKWHNVTCDQFPLLFYDLAKDGYRTAYLEGDPQIGTFQLRFVGFRHQPTDHYIRPFLLEVDQPRWPRIKQAHCVGNTPQYKLLMDLTSQFLHLQGKKFIFTFVSDISHDDFSMIATADDDFAAFLEGFQREGFAKDTMLVVMGDHGPRFSQKYRETRQGRLEERLPLMAIVLPQKLKLERPAALAALRDNVDTLTTPHDIHTTLLDAIGLREYWNPYTVPGADIPRGMSLLGPIPSNRSCSEAGVTPHWCACLSWLDVPRSDPVFAKASMALVRYINDVTEPFRIYCSHRTLIAVRWVMKITNRRGRKETYQVKVTVDPGKGDFEATMTHYIESDTIHLDSREISRTNLYKDEPWCISKSQPHLSPFCYCRN